MEDDEEEMTNRSGKGEGTKRVHSGVSEAGVLEVLLPTHGRPGGAAMGKWRRWPRLFLTVMAAVAIHMILIRPVALLPWRQLPGRH
ncbi:hypothetical protein E2C01_022160 [Portunus trituberculatus]|uniref:Uncharacterized protein n=1 Tax=Portunus trituberculatus TaxID=210409 RepID=A0A5B7E859_PORTR|nr:hypothetical protein [Portunus trituberculatus]